MMAFLRMAYASPARDPTAQLERRSEGYAFTSEAIGPAHDGKRSAVRDR